MAQKIMLNPLALVLALVLSSTLCVTNMDKISFDYSMKNVPIPSKEEYRLEFIQSVNIFIKNMTWRAWHYLNPNETGNFKETFGFNTSKCPPFVPEFKTLQDNLQDLTKNIEFKDKNFNNFQHQLKKDLKTINTEKRMIVPADKSTNYYKVDQDMYKDLLQKNITKDYKKADENIIEKINKEDKDIAKKLEIDDRVYKTSKRETFLTLKDHKPNFPNNPKCRILNPTKPELGKVSKKKLEIIVKVVREKSQLNHWRNTQEVIMWFQKINNSITERERLSFINFDVIDFYPSISEKLLLDALKYAEKFIKISTEDKKLFLHVRKSFLINEGKPWHKKQNEKFDVAQGAFDSAEVCELVGLFLLSQLSHLHINPGLYRDDGLAVSSLSPRNTEIVKKEICKIFERNGLQIDICANMKSVNFLDINIDISTGIFKPYVKPNNVSQYVHKILAQ